MFNIEEKSVNFWNDDTFTRTSSVRDVQVVLEWNKF